jgi:hypothetical protein
MPWKILLAAALVTALLAAIKFLFDRIEKKRRPKE